MMIKSTLALFLAALTAAGCEANGQPIQDAHPAGRATLVEIAPECRHPSSVNYAACKKAAEILEADPQGATWIYANNWSHVAFDGKGLSGGGGGGGSGGSCGGGDCSVPDMNLGGGGGDGAAAALVVLVVIGIVVVGVVVAEQAAHEARVRAAHRITTRALRLVYSRSGDPWSQQMLAELGAVRYDSRGSYRRFVDAAGR